MFSRKLKIFTKILFCILLVYMVIANISIVKATEGAGLLQKMEEQANGFIQKGQQSAEGNINYDNIAKEFKGLGQILTMVGAGVMVAITTYMGIKYLTAGPEAQAKLKVQLIGVVVSGMVIFRSIQHLDNSYKNCI